MRVGDWFGRLTQSDTSVWAPVLLMVAVGVGIALILWRARDKYLVAAPVYWIGVFCVALFWIIAIFRLRLHFSVPIAAAATFVFMNLIPFARSRRR